MEVGSKVVCIDDSRDIKTIKTHPSWVREGETYIVRAVEGSLDLEVRILLEELSNPSIYISQLGGYAEPGFAGRRFMPYEDYILHGTKENEEVEQITI